VNEDGPYAVVATVQAIALTVFWLVAIVTIPLWLPVPLLLRYARRRRGSPRNESVPTFSPNTTRTPTKSTTGRISSNIYATTSRNCSNS
jgi:hypothetical protein